ncbi:hypothetical protein CC2G_003455 [Coprinopsis cinerea AmutBmut pab1-1]|nr:hypothetical protein CC2G_003455 [Coprinopsis cinerea AmutBmut pab1-1]
MNTLPSELLEFIFEEFTESFDDDPKTLASCSLVSRAFCAAAQPLLFRSISLKRAEQTQRFATAVTNNCDHLALHVHNVEIWPPTYAGDFPPYDALARIELPNLVKLVLGAPDHCLLFGTNQRWNEFPIAMQNWILDVCNGKRTARIQTLRIECYLDIPPSILQTGPSLKNLTLIRTRFEPGKLRELSALASRDGDPAGANLCRPRLLGFSESQRDLLSLDAKIFSQIEEIIIDVKSDGLEDRRTTNDMLQASASTVNSVGFKLCSDFTSPLSPALHDLGSLKNLTSLMFITERAFSSTHISAIANTLSTLQPGIPLKALGILLDGYSQLGDPYGRLKNIPFMAPLGVGDAIAWKKLDVSISSLAHSLRSTLSEVFIDFQVRLRLPDTFEGDEQQSQGWNEHCGEVREMFIAPVELLPQASKSEIFHFEFRVLKA